MLARSLRFIFSTAKAAHLAGRVAIINTLTAWSPSLIKQVELIAPHFSQNDVWLVTFKNEGIAQQYCNQTVKVGTGECVIENAMHKRGSAATVTNKSRTVQAYHTRVVFRISGMPPNVNGLELLKELNHCGFKLTNISDLAHVLCTENCIKDLRIKSGVIEVRQPCPKTEQETYQNLAFGKKKLTLSGKLYNVKFSRPGICFKCNSFGHRAFECPKMEELKATWLENQTCNFCHLKGHLVRSCKKLEKKKSREEGLARFEQVASPSTNEQTGGDVTLEGSDDNTTIVAKHSQPQVDQWDTPCKKMHGMHKSVWASSPMLGQPQKPSAPGNENTITRKRSVTEADLTPPTTIYVRQKQDTQLSPICLDDQSSESETSNTFCDNDELNEMEITASDHSTINATNDTQIESIQSAELQSRPNSLDPLNIQNASNE